VYTTKRSKLEFALEWISTSVLIVGVYLTAVNYYPLNVWVSLAGNTGWLIVAWLWRKWSLIVVQLIITLVYIIGIYVK
jgi:hypothetical protein